ncbi:MAG: helix-turn-helix transcriptional regulator [Sporichthyaceae bacterium]
MSLPNNLPVHLTSFVGREQEQAELGELSRRHRLVTLTGSGGAGKTRLAARVAGDLAADFADGVCWIELAPHSDPALVADATLAALGVADTGDRPALQRLVAHLAVREALLVLDNCEHLVGACADLADTVLRACPGVRMLATSRQGLGVGGEIAWQVPPLRLPAPGEDVGFETLGSFEAVRLFVERAVQARHNFAVGNETAPVVAEICARLDGIPLAIELAAARVRVLSPQQILDGLADRFRLLTGGSRTALPRQQTLEASVAWSHDQLAAPERAVFRRLAVFAGGFTLDGAEAVCSSGSGPGRPDVLDLLDSLIAKSLVVVEERDGQLRYRMLETLRQFAALQLDSVGEAASARDAHARCCLELAGRAQERLVSATAAALRDLVVELDNYRAALDWAIAGRDAPTALGIGYAHAWLLNLRGRYREAREWLNRVLALPDGSSRARGFAICWRAYAEWSMADWDAVEASTAQMLALAQECADDVLLARGHNMATWVSMFRDPASAQRDLAEGWRLIDESDDPWVALNLPCDYAHVVMRCDDLDASEVWLERATAACVRYGNDHFLAWTLAAEVSVACRRGQLPRSLAAGRRAVELGRGFGDVVLAGYGAAVLAWSEILAGRTEDALVTVERAMREGEQAGEGISWAELHLARAVAAGVLGEADWLSGVERALRIGTDLEDPRQSSMAALVLVAALVDRGEHDRAEALIRAARRDGVALGSPWVEAACDHAAGLLAAARGESGGAEDLQHAALARAVAGGYALLVVDALEALADLASAADSDAEAARLFGAMARRRDELGYHHGRRDRAEACEDAHAEGRGLSVDEAIAYASRARGARKRPSSGWDSLTPTELEVARLAATGIGNPAIGERLFITAGTVKVHLSHIYAKLGIGNRTALTAEVTRRLG